MAIIDSEILGLLLYASMFAFLPFFLSFLYSLMIEELRSPEVPIGLDGRKINLTNLGTSYAYSISNGDTTAKLTSKNEKFVEDLKAKLTVHYTNRIDMALESEEVEEINLTKNDREFELNNENNNFAIVKINDTDLKLSDKFYEKLDKFERKRKIKTKVFGILSAICFFNLFFLIPILSRF